MDRLPSARLRVACTKPQALANVRRIIERFAEADQRQLLLVSADPATRMTALAHAAEDNNLEVVDYLLSVGAEQTAISRDIDNNTVLHIAARIGSPLIIQRYYDHFAFVLDWANAQGCTALHTAAQAGHLDAVEVRDTPDCRHLTYQMLLELGADCDLPDFQGDTPLHYAAAWGHGDVAQLLITRGATFNAKNDKGWTAAEYAYSFEIIRVLSDAVQAVFEASKQERARRKRQAKSIKTAQADDGSSTHAGTDEPATPVGLGFNLPRSDSMSPGAAPILAASTSTRSLREKLLLTPVTSSPGQPSSPSSPDMRSVIAGISQRDGQAIASFRSSPVVASPTPRAPGSPPHPSRGPLSAADRGSPRASPRAGRLRTTSDNSIQPLSTPLRLDGDEPVVLGSVAQRRSRAPT